MRIGGAFPIPEPMFPVGLVGGGIYYPPPGNYWAIVPSNVTIELWDQNMTQWRQVITGPNGEAVLTTDGFNMRLRNPTSGISVSSITAGSGGTNGIGTTATGVTLSVAAPLGSNPRQATLYPIVGGAISAAITVAGSGLLVPPRLIVDPPPKGGRRAVLDCVISGGAVAAVTVIDAGAGYASVPAITVIPQLAGIAADSAPAPNTAAQIGATPILGTPGDFFQTYINGGVFTTLPVITASLTGSGTLTGAVVVDPGQNYTAVAPAVTVSGGGLGGGAAVTLATVTAAANATAFLQAMLQ